MDIKRDILRKNKFLSSLSTVFTDSFKIVLSPQKSNVDKYLNLSTSKDIDKVKLSNDYLMVGNDLRKAMFDYDDKH